MPFAQAALAQQTLGAGGVTGKLVLMTAAAASFVIIACRGPAANEPQHAVETTMCQNSLQFARNAVNAISQSTRRAPRAVSKRTVGLEQRVATRPSARSRVRGWGTRSRPQSSQSRLH